MQNRGRSYALMAGVCSQKVGPAHVNRRYFILVSNLAKKIRNQYVYCCCKNEICENRKSVVALHEAVNITCHREVDVDLR